jgi:hypothetical protein
MSMARHPMMVVMAGMMRSQLIVSAVKCCGLRPCAES